MKKSEINNSVSAAGFKYRAKSFQLEFLTYEYVTLTNLLYIKSHFPNASECFFNNFETTFLLGFQDQ